MGTPSIGVFFVGSFANLFGRPVCDVSFELARRVTPRVRTSGFATPHQPLGFRRCLRHHSQHVLDVVALGGHRADRPRGRSTLGWTCHIIVEPLTHRQFGLLAQSMAMAWVSFFELRFLGAQNIAPSIAFMRAMLLGGLVVLGIELADFLLFFA
jgi:hypothetical protein